MTQQDSIHDLADFMRQVSAEMSSEYDRIQRRAREDPGTAGDQGEENWATLLKDWLPSTYQVVTKGRIIGEDGRTSPQVDVIILKDVYPRKLLDKKLYLAGGVAAVFECKTTLRAEHIAQAVETSVKLKSLYHQQTGTLYRELHAPVVYGLLAHSHEWQRPNSQPQENISKNLIESDKSVVSHPKDSLDLLCVADVGTWNLTKHSFLPEEGFRRMVQIQAKNLGVPENMLLAAWGPPEGIVDVAWTSYYSHAMQDERQSDTFTPIGCLLAHLSTKLAWENPSLRGLAEYYKGAGMEGQGSGNMRFWSVSGTYSEAVQKQMPMRSTNERWNEWSSFYF